MTKQEAEKELIHVVNDILNPYNDREVEIEAYFLAEAGWRIVPQAEWKTNTEQFSNIYNHFYCSHCGNYTDERNPHKLGKYCSFCGAEMIGKG